VRSVLRALTRPDARRFNLAFVSVVLAGWALVGAVLALLKAADSLPPTPLTATPCMNAKFDFLRAQAASGRLQRANLLAVGSSVTGRNLDMAALVAERPDLEPLNAATCFLHVDQTAYLAAFLLDRLPAVETLLVVLAPRDFEHCPPQDTAFFDDEAVDAFVMHGASPVWSYATGLQPRSFFQVGWWLTRNDELREALSVDRWGSTPLTRRLHWMPEPAFDERCFEALATLRRVAVERGVRLVLVHFPVQPEWRRRFDPQGHLVAAFRGRVARTVAGEGVTIVDTDATRLRAEDFADPMHLLWSSAPIFTRHVARRLAQH
jgi:hypothetical protein